MHQTTSLLRVETIHVAGLFGLYTHTVDLNLDDRITIIHGPNGVGKTVLLRLVHALFSGRFNECIRTPMERLEISLSDGTTVGFQPIGDASGLPLDGQQPPKPKGMIYRLSDDNPRQEDWIEFDQRELLSWVTKFADQSPYLTRIESDRWVDRRDETVSTSLDLLFQYQDRMPDEVRRKIFNEPQWFSDVRKQISVHIIETQRLVRFQRPESSPYRVSREFTSTVREYARDLATRIRDALTQYARVSQSLDQSFPRRLLEGPQAQPSVETLKDRLQLLEKNRERLKSIGLLDRDYSYPFNPDTLNNVDPTKRDAMTLYVEDTREKLGVFEDLAKRIESLLTNVNGKFRNTSIQVNRESGLYAVGGGSKKVDLDSLSSGEQHELVLLYDLLFRVKPNTLILIDEPELSLHIVWQKRFLADLIDIVSINNCDVLLATHSIFIAGDRPDLMVALSQDETME